MCFSHDQLHINIDIDCINKLAFEWNFGGNAAEHWIIRIKYFGCFQFTFLFEGTGNMGQNDFF